MREVENGDCGSAGMKLQLDERNKSRDLPYNIVPIVSSAVVV